MLPDVRLEDRFGFVHVRPIGRPTRVFLLISHPGLGGATKTGVRKVVAVRVFSPPPFVDATAEN